MKHWTALCTPTANRLGIPVEQVTPDDLFEHAVGSCDDNASCTHPTLGIARGVSALGGYTIACEEWPHSTDLITGFGAEGVGGDA